VTRSIFEEGTIQHTILGLYTFFSSSPSQCYWLKASGFHMIQLDSFNTLLLLLLLHYRRSHEENNLSESKLGQ